MNPKLRKLLPLIFAGIMGVIGIMLTRGFLAKQQEIVEAEKQRIYEQLGRPIDVVVATRGIGKGMIITPQDLGMRKVPESFVQPTAIIDPNQVVNMQALVDIASGEQILVNKIREPKEKAPDNLAQLMPPGSRAVSIEADIVTGVGGLIKAGDLVDVIWTSDELDDMGAVGKTSAAVTLFQAVPVLAIDTDIFTPPQLRDNEIEFSGDPTTRRKVDPRQKRTTVTLALTPDAANVLLYARSRGEIQLSLRSPAEKLNKVPLQAVDDEALLRAVLGDDAVPEKIPMREVEVFKGLDRSVVSVKDSSPESEEE